MKRDYFVVLGGILILTFAFLMDMTDRGLQPGTYQCVDCEHKAKTGNSNGDYDEIYVDGIITDIQVKAGQGCYFPDGTCYEIIDGGVGFNYVKVRRVGDGPSCQAISHLEVCFDVASPTETEVPTSTFTPDLPTETPTDTEKPTSTYTPEPSPTATETVSPEPSESEEPTMTPTETITPTFTPWPSRTLGPTPTSNGNGRG